MNWSWGGWQGCPGDGCEASWTHRNDLWVAIVMELREGLAVAEGSEGPELERFAVSLTQGGQFDILSRGG